MLETTPLLETTQKNSLRVISAVQLKFVCVCQRLALQNIAYSTLSCIFHCMLTLASDTCVYTCVYTCMWYYQSTILSLLLCMHVGTVNKISSFGIEAYTLSSVRTCMMVVKASPPPEIVENYIIAESESLPGDCM